MAERVYIETSFVGYLTSRPSRDLVFAGHQQITRDWWETRRQNFELCTSDLVIQEASARDPSAAQERIDILLPMTKVETTSEALALAKELVQMGAMPVKAAEDALHVAICAVQGIPFLLTWNCRHMANAVLRPTIDKTCTNMGFRAPVICTPEELMEPQP